MKKTFFEKIADFIEGKKKEEFSDKEQTLEPSVINKTADEASNAFQTENIVINGITNRLNSIYKGKQDSFDQKILVIWTTDNLLFTIINNEEFRAKLSTTLNEENGYEFANIKANLSNSSRDIQHCTKISEAIYIQIEENSIQTPIARKARIRALQENGSLLQPEYILDSDTLINTNQHFYNIGAGEFPDTRGQGHRKNHIAIDDRTDSPQYNNNKYVSRAHARIGFLPQEGFCLYVETGGSRLAGKRTRIFRGEKIIEVENTIIPIPLQNGDLIELGKHVILCFNEIL